MDLKTFLFHLIVIYISARLLGEVAGRMGQPSVLGELLAGVLVGPSLLGLVQPTEILTLLGEIGVMLLLFEVGLESDLQAFLQSRAFGSHCRTHRCGGPIRVGLCRCDAFAPDPAPIDLYRRHTHRNQRRHFCSRFVRSGPT